MTCLSNFATKKQNIIVATNPQRYAQRISYLQP